MRTQSGQIEVLVAAGYRPAQVAAMTATEVFEKSLHLVQFAMCCLPGCDCPLCTDAVLDYDATVRFLRQLKPKRLLEVVREQVGAMNA
jgi:hypothetical protein